MNKILVTGAGGFIGAHLCRDLAQRGFDVRALDNYARGLPRRLSAIRSEIEIIQGDVRSYETMRKACHGVDTIIHLAAINGTENFYARPHEVLNVGIRGMLTVADIFKEQDIPNLIIASSSEVYQTPRIIPTPEDTALVVPDVTNPRYSYGGGKLASELIVTHLPLKPHQRTLIFRPHNVYGPDMGFEHVIPQFIMRAHEAAQHSTDDRINFPIQGDGTQTRSFLYIDDFIEGLMIAVNNMCGKDIVHIGSDTGEISIADLAIAIGALFGKSLAIVPGDLPKGGTLRRLPNIDKLKAWNFAPRTPLDMGLKKTLSWYLDNMAHWPANGANLI